MTIVGLALLLGLVPLLMMMLLLPATSLLTVGVLLCSLLPLLAIRFLARGFGIHQLEAIFLRKKWWGRRVKGDTPPLV